MAQEERYVAYVGTYTHRNSVGIHVYDVDVNEGVLTERSVAPINNPSYLCVSANGKFVYSIADEGVASFKIDENGDLVKLNQTWIGGMRGCFVTTDSQNRYLFVAGYHDGRVTMMNLNEDGSIGEIADGIFHQGLSMTSFETRSEPHVTCVYLTPDEKYLCAVDSGLDQVKVYSIDYERGKLALANMIRLPLGAHPRMIRFSNNGTHAYILSEITNTVSVYAYHEDKKYGPVFERQQVLHLFTKADNAASATMEFSNDGKYLYVTVDARNSVACVTVHEDGSLEWSSTTRCSGDYPKAMAVLPGDKMYAVLNHDTNEIRTFVINHEDRYCLMKNAPIKIQTPNCIAIHKLV